MQDRPVADGLAVLVQLLHLDLRVPELLLLRHLHRAQVGRRVLLDQALPLQPVEIRGEDLPRALQCAVSDAALLLVGQVVPQVVDRDPPRRHGDELHHPPDHVLIPGDRLLAPALHPHGRQVAAEQVVVPVLPDLDASHVVALQHVADHVHDLRHIADRHLVRQRLFRLPQEVHFRVYCHVVISFHPATKATKEPSFLYNLFIKCFSLYFWYPLVARGLYILKILTFTGNRLATDPATDGN